VRCPRSSIVRLTFRSTRTPIIRWLSCGEFQFSLRSSHSSTISHFGKSPLPQFGGSFYFFPLGTHASFILRTSKSKTPSPPLKIHLSASLFLRPLALALAVRAPPRRLFRRFFFFLLVSFFPPRNPSTSHCPDPSSRLTLLPPSDAI